jgi:hypothetical protein
VTSGGHASIGKPRPGRYSGPEITGEYRKLVGHRSAAAAGRGGGGYRCDAHR